VQSTQSFDAVLKHLFSKRGEARRINEGERIGRPAYQALNLNQEFDEAFDAMRYCRVIRNQWAHCEWWDDNSGQLAFANIEEIARVATPIPNLRALNPEHVDVPLLVQQEAFYVYVDELFRWVNFEGRRRAGLPSTP